MKQKLSQEEPWQTETTGGKGEGKAGGKGEGLKGRVKGREMGE
jgi:hypothetical protein